MSEFNFEAADQPDPTQMMSLYEYLGKAAGAELGKEVAQYATALRAKMDKRKVNTLTYKGDVILYERQFLDQYFGFPKDDNLTY
jgi:hypothetical protein